MVSWSPEKLLPAHVRQFVPYVPSRPDAELMKLYGCTRLHRLNNNENALGPPGKAREVLRRFPPRRAAVYPSGDAYYLKVTLAERFGMHPDQFLVGNGANEVISFVIKAFCEQGDNIVTADKTFAVYEWVAQFSGCEARLVPLEDLAFDAQGMLDRVDERTKVLFVCNPNNPTGTYWNRQRLIDFLDRIHGRCMVVVDEAYGEFVEDDDYPDSISLTEQYPNLLVFRTFSKMYGLAALRIGYVAGSLEAVDAIRRTCIVYSVNMVAQEAALAAIEDDEHILRTREMVRTGKDLLRQGLGGLGLPFIMGEGNFVLIKLPMSDTLAYRKLMKHGIMIRAMTGFRLPNYIRVTISTEDVMETFLEALSRVLP